MKLIEYINMELGYETGLRNNTIYHTYNLLKKKGIQDSEIMSMLFAIINKLDYEAN